MGLVLLGGCSRHEDASWFRSTVLKLGERYDSEPVVGRLAFRNASAQERTIWMVEGSCECTAITVSVAGREYVPINSRDGGGFRALEAADTSSWVKGIEVDAGASGYLDVEISTGDLRKKRAFVYVHKDDPEQPLTRLAFEVDVQSTFEIEPPEVVLRRVRVGEKRSFVVKVHSTRLKDFQFTEVLSEPVGLRTTLEKGRVGGYPGYTIKGQLMVSEVGKQVGGAIRLQTGYKGMVVSIPIVVDVLDPIIIDPRGPIVFGMISSQVGAQRIVTLAPRHAGEKVVVKEVEVEELSFDSRYLEVSVGEADVGLELKARILPGVESGTRIGGRVRMSLAKPNSAERVFELLGFVRRE